MREVDRYFRQKTQLINFIELKNDKDYQLLDKSLNYPVIQSAFFNSLTKGYLNEGVNLSYIIDAIAVLYSVDREFKDMPLYEYLIKKALVNPSGYFTKKGLEYLEESEELAVHFFRYNYLHGVQDEFNDYNYARCLYNLYLKEMSKPELRNESIKILERLTKEKPEFPLSYYQLAKINEIEGYYLKADLYYKKSLDRLEKHEIRSMLEKERASIRAKVFTEKAWDLLEKAKLEEARKNLEEAIEIEDNPDSYYLLGKINSLEENGPMAIKCYEKALELSSNKRELYQDLAVEYFSNRNSDMALKTLDDGLKLYTDDAYLIYNKIIINVNLGKLRNAKEDIARLLEYGDLPSDVIEGIIEIKKIIEKLD